MAAPPAGTAPVSSPSVKYLVTVVGESGATFAYEVDAPTARRPRTVGHAVWHHHMRLGQEDADPRDVHVAQLTGTATTPIPAVPTSRG
ncbi:hypothetical protein ACN20G_33625 (plasmid) [Streptomyces sp. BI20]|uniref:hypothetical protein n=1 Tax=Streptomyces sp. BI20 TaxID=3403460 RepID=UPI003C7863CD